MVSWLRSSLQESSIQPCTKLGTGRGGSRIQVNKFSRKNLIWGTNSKGIGKAGIKKNKAHCLGDSEFNIRKLLSP